MPNTPLPRAGLSQARKADRAEMANQIEELSKTYGFSCASTHKGVGRSLEIEIRIITLRGLSLSMRIGNREAFRNVNHYLLNWHGQMESNFKLAMMFGISLGGSINEYHFGKATHLAHGFPDLMDTLRAAFEMIKSGAAFQPDNLPPKTRFAPNIQLPKGYGSHA